MVGTWKVTSNCFDGKKVYAVYRLRNIAEVDHSGNREFATGYMDDRKEADDIAEKLNNQEN